MGGPDDGDAILQLIAAVAELRDATHTYASQTTATFQRMEAVLETMLDVAGETKARLDDHEARLTDLERGKK